jgi:hypothetical protein
MTSFLVEAAERAGRRNDAGRWQEILKWLLTLFFNYADQQVSV